MKKSPFLIVLTGFFCLTHCIGLADEKKEDKTDPPKVETKQQEKDVEWISLIKDENLDGWTFPGYGGEGEITFKDGEVTIGSGIASTGMRYEKEFPKTNYEIQYDAKRQQGYDFFGALTFPVGDSFCTFINGGWGGGVVGISSLDGYDASENKTTQYYSFKSKHWFHFRILVTEDKIKVWITKEGEEPELKIDIETADHKISTRLEARTFQPLGIATYCTEGIVKDLKYRILKPEEVQKIKEEIKQETKKSS